MQLTVECPEGLCVRRDWDLGDAAYYGNIGDLIPILATLDAYPKISLVFVEGVFRQKSICVKVSWPFPGLPVPPSVSGLMPQ
jgi:hypothetical protein